MRARRINQVIGRNIRDRRRQLHLSPVEVAARGGELGVHISRDVLEPIERGTRAARAHELVALAAILQTTPTKLLAPSQAYERTIVFGDCETPAISVSRFAQWLFMPDDEPPAPCPHEARAGLGARRINTEPRSTDDLLARSLGVDQLQEVGACLAMQRATQLLLTPTAIAFTDTDLRIRLMNPAWLELFGYTATDVGGGMPVVATLADRSALQRLDFGPSGRERFVRTPPLERIRKDGTTFWAESALLAAVTPDGSTIGVWGVTLPVPDPRHRHERGATDIADYDALVTVDQNIEILEFSPGAENLYGRERDDALGRSFFEVAGLTHATPTLDLMTRIAQHDNFRYQAEHTDRAGNRFCADVRVVGARSTRGLHDRIRLYITRTTTSQDG